MKWILLIVNLMLVAFPARAASDFQQWTELGVRYKLSRQLRLKFNQHFRLDEEFGGFTRHKFITGLAVYWRVSRFLRLEAGYRYRADLIENRENCGSPCVDSWHRFHFDVRLRYRIKPVRLRYRLRLHEMLGNRWWGGPVLETIHSIRNRIGVDVKLAWGFVPFLLGELFIRIDDPDGALHKWWVTGGLDWEVGSHVVTVFYRLEEMLGDPQDPTRHILGTEYHYAF